MRLRDRGPWRFPYFGLFRVRATSETVYSSGRVGRELARRGFGRRLATSIGACWRTAGSDFTRLLARITLREEAADDLLQELFLKLSRSRGFLGATRPEAYAHRVAVRMAFDWRRDQSAEIQSPLWIMTWPDGGPPPLAGLAAREELEIVLAAMERLSTQAQQVLTMRFLEDRRYDEIADELGRSAHQARSMCHKAIAKLRRLVDRRLIRRIKREPRDG